MSDLMETEIANALKVIKGGGVILNPTDTIWGLGCDATNPKAVEKIYSIKRRAEAKSFIILLDNMEKLALYVGHIPDIASDLIGNIGNPVTVIYSNGRNLAPNLIGADGTIGIRIVQDDFCHALISRFGKPIVSTSANFSGEMTPDIFSHISEEIKQSVDYIVKYKQENFTRSKASTIIRLYEDGSYTIIRN